MLCCLLTLPLPAAAEGMARQFADCAGRLSALREHQWLVDPAASDATGAEMTVMADLAEAAAEDPVQAMGWRVAAKAAHRGLLMQATFEEDPALALAARRRAEGLEATCRSLMAGQ